jgi:hypothetical protein
MVMITLFDNVDIITVYNLQTSTLHKVTPFDTLSASIVILLVKCMQCATLDYL